MKSFTDNAGRLWTLAVNVAAIKRVRAICDVDLNSIVELDAKNNPTAKLLERLSTDPVLLVDVLYAVCKDQADKLGVTDEQFGAAMVGDGIEQASMALLEAIADFFPARRRELMHKLLSRAKQLDTVMLDEADRRLEEMAAAVSPPSTASDSAMSLPEPSA